MPTGFEGQLDRLRESVTIAVPNLDLDGLARGIAEAEMEFGAPHAGMTVAPVDLADQNAPVRPGDGDGGPDSGTGQTFGVPRIDPCLSKGPRARRKADV